MAWNPILASSGLLYGVTVGAALLAAIFKQIIAKIGGIRWNWVEFIQDVVTNVFIAFILAVVADVLKKQQQAARNAARAYWCC